MVASLVAEHRLDIAGLAAGAHWLSWSVACGILWTRVPIHVPCTGRQILDH